MRSLRPSSQRLRSSGASRSCRRSRSTSPLESCGRPMRRVSRLLQPQDSTLALLPVTLPGNAQERTRGRLPSRPGDRASTGDATLRGDKAMMRRLAHCLAVIGVVSLLTTLVGLVAAGRADAQGSEKGPGNPTILDAVRALQGSVNTLQTSVNTLQTTVNGLVTNGVNAKPRHFYLTKATHQG